MSEYMCICIHNKFICTHALMYFLTHKHMHMHMNMCICVCEHARKVDFFC